MGGWRRWPIIVMRRISLKDVIIKLVQRPRTLRDLLLNILRQLPRQLPVERAVNAQVNSAKAKLQRRQLAWVGYSTVFLTNG